MPAWTVAMLIAICIRPQQLAQLPCCKLQQVLQHVMCTLEIASQLSYDVITACVIKQAKPMQIYTNTCTVLLAATAAPWPVRPLNRADNAATLPTCATLKRSESAQTACARHSRDRAGSLPVRADRLHETVHASPCTGRAH